MATESTNVNRDAQDGEISGADLWLLSSHRVIYRSRRWAAAVLVALVFISGFVGGSITVHRPIESVGTLFGLALLYWLLLFSLSNPAE